MPQPKKAAGVRALRRLLPMGMGMMGGMGGFGGMGGGRRAARRVR